MSSDLHQDHTTGRPYDYGPGLGARARVELRVAGLGRLGLAFDGFRIHSVSGTAEEHFVRFLDGRLVVPIQGAVGVGLEYHVVWRTSAYADRSMVRRTDEQLRIFLDWVL